jgi:hypothetical protein
VLSEGATLGSQASLEKQRAVEPAGFSPRPRSVHDGSEKIRRHTVALARKTNVAVQCVRPEIDKRILISILISSLHT